MRIFKTAKRCTTSAPAHIIHIHFIHTLKAIMLSNARHWFAYSRTLLNNQSTTGDKQDSVCAVNSNKMTKMLKFIVASRESFCQYQTRQSQGTFRRFRKMAKSKLASSCLSVCPSLPPSVRPFVWIKSTTTVRIFMKV